MKRRLPPPKIKLVIFDLDGTLVDAFRAIADSIDHMMGQMELKTPGFYKIKRAVGWGVDTLVRGFVPPERTEEALRIFRAHHDKRLRQNIRLLSGAKTLLPYLKKRGCTLAIASNRPAKFCHIIMEELGIDHYFDHVICGDSVKAPKPHPEMIRKILKAARCRPAETVYVGDMTVDIQAGKAAGVFTVGVPTGTCTAAEVRSAQPDAMIPRLSAVRKIVR